MAIGRDVDPFELEQRRRELDRRRRVRDVNPNQLDRRRRVRDVNPDRLGPRAPQPRPDETPDQRRRRRERERERENERREREDERRANTLIWQDMLDRFDLGDLIPLIERLLRDPTMTTEAIWARIRDTATYKQRFQAIIEREKKGLPALSEEEVLAFERQATGIMRAAGLPEGFYDNHRDFVNLLVNDVSAAELSRRVVQGFARVEAAPPEIRRFFADAFGPRGDAALATYFLDPERSEQDIAHAIEVATIGGRAAQSGLRFTAPRAERLVRLGISEQQAVDAFRQVGLQEGLFRETFAERKNLTAERHGVDSALGLDDSVQERLEGRLADFGGGGGAFISSQGISV